MPIDDDVIERVEHLDTEQKSLVTTDDYAMFEWIPGVKTDNKNKEEDELEIYI